MIHAWLYPPVFTSIGSAALTLERTPLVAALQLVQQHAAGDLSLWLGGATLVLELETATGTTMQISLLGQCGTEGDATARGPIAALNELLRTCPADMPAVTLVASPAGLTWSREVTA